MNKDSLKQAAIDFARKAFDSRSDVSLHNLVDKVAELEGNAKDLAVNALEQGAMYNAVGYAFNILADKTPLPKFLADILKGWVVGYLKNKFA